MTDVATTPVEAPPIFEAKDLHVHFEGRGRKGKRKVVRALDGIDMSWNKGEVLGIVGESGCGKSTLGRTLLGLQPPTEGEICFEGSPLADANMRKLRRRVQMVFQDPYQSFSPRQSVGSLVQEPLAIHGLEKKGIDRIQRGGRCPGSRRARARRALLEPVPARAVGGPAPARRDRVGDGARARGPSVR